MIEFEVKYQLKTMFDEKKLVDCTFLREGYEEDIYYDTPNYELLKKGNFMRLRNNNRIDFKLDLGDSEHLFCKETKFSIDSINENNVNYLNIFKSLNINTCKTFDSFFSFINNNNFQILAPIKKHRKVYKTSDGIKVTIDVAEDIGLFIEAEIQLDDNTVINKQDIMDRITLSMKKHKILDQSFSVINIGYVELYLLKNNKKAYNLGKFKQ